MELLGAFPLSPVDGYRLFFASKEVLRPLLEMQ